MLSFVISPLLEFKTNTAYDRWCEERKIWAALVNNSRNFALTLAVILSEENNREYCRKMIPSYAATLNKHLKDEETGLQLFDGVDLEIDHHKHKPNQVAKMLFHKVNNLYDSKKITGDQLIILNEEIKSFTNICGAS